jgi:hypothetical protein
MDEFHAGSSANRRSTNPEREDQPIGGLRKAKEGASYGVKDSAGVKRRTRSSANTDAGDATIKGEMQVGQTEQRFFSGS